MRAIRRFAPALVVLATAMLAGGFQGAAPATAAPSCPILEGVQLTVSQSVSPPGGNSFVVCTGRVRTFDGTPIHLDVTLPTVPYVPEGARKPATPPLVLLLSGWSNDICQFESTTLEGAAVPGCTDFIGNAGYHWNNAWFASHGIVSLSYTPRGWYDSCGRDPSSGYTYLTDPMCNDTPGEASWTHLYDRRFEIRDAQYFSGLLVDTGVVDPNHIVTTGDSGGGGPSWDLALSRDQVVQLDSTPSHVDTTPWTSPNGTPLHLAAALPMYTWTDLVDSLMPNGRAADGFAGAPDDGDHLSPIGVEKASYVTGLLALGVAGVQTAQDHGAQFAVPGTDPTADLITWYAAINAGEPTFSLNPMTPSVIAQVGGPLRSSYRMPVPPKSAEKPVFVIQGMTDPLFPSLQALAMVNRLKAVDPSYPVTAFYGDVGHSYATNPLDVWQQAHDEGNAWLANVLAHQGTSQPQVTVDTTRCVAGQTLQSFTGNNLGAMQSSTVAFGSAASQTIVHAAPLSPPNATYEGLQTDPIANSGCRSMQASLGDPSPSQVSYVFPLTSPVTLLGGPTVRATAAVSGSDAELVARLWDLDAAGTQTLISQSAYRIENPGLLPATQSLAFELWPNAWQLQAGHSVKLELTQDDFPTWRPDNEPAAITLSNLSLTLPVH